MVGLVRRQRLGRGPICPGGQYYDLENRKDAMTTETTMTVKGQVTVPREIRDRQGLKAGDRMAFTLLSNGTVIMPSSLPRQRIASKVLLGMESPWPSRPEAFASC